MYAVRDGDLIYPDLSARLLNDARTHFHKSPDELPSVSDEDPVRALGSGQLAEAKLWKAQRAKYLFAQLRIEKTPQLIASAHPGFRQDSI